YGAAHPTHNIINVRYRKKTSTGWQTAEWVTEIFSIYGQYYVSIAMDSQDNVHLAWQGTGWGVNTGKYNIQYRKRTNSGWQTQEAITDESTSRYHPSIAIDSEDNVHLAWAYNGKYRKRTRGGWGIEETIGFTSPTDLSLALTRTDLLVVVAEETIGSVAHLYYSQRQSGSWTTPEAITSDTDDDYAPILLWAKYPVLKGMPSRGFNLAASHGRPESLITSHAGGFSMPVNERAQSTLTPKGGTTIAIRQL
ncbi:unnamed protein product, partial [marine sediment metagenome]